MVASVSKGLRLTTCSRRHQDRLESPRSDAGLHFCDTLGSRARTSVGLRVRSRPRLGRVWEATDQPVSRMDVPLSSLVPSTLSKNINGKEILG